MAKAAPLIDLADSSRPFFAELLALDDWLFKAVSNKLMIEFREKCTRTISAMMKGIAAPVTISGMSSTIRASIASVKKN